MCSTTCVRRTDGIIVGLLLPAEEFLAVFHCSVDVVQGVVMLLVCKDLFESVAERILISSYSLHIANNKSVSSIAALSNRTRATLQDNPYLIAE